MISNLFEKKWFVILFSVVLSLIMWYYVVLQVDPTYTNTIEITNLQTPGIEELTKSGLYVEDDFENMSFKARVSGKRSLVTKNYDEYYIELDLTKIKSAGEHQTVAKVIAPSGVTVKHLTPELIDIKVDNGEKKVIKPKLKGVGNTKDSFELTLADSEITISGKPSAIGKITSVEVVVDCDKLKKTGTNKYKVTLLDAEGNPYDDASLTVSKEVEVVIKRKKTVDVKVTNEPYFLKELSKNYDIRMTVEDNSAVVYGFDEDLKNIDYVEADLSQATFNAATKEEKVSARLTIPDNLIGIIDFSEDETRYRDVTIKYTLKK